MNLDVEKTFDTMTKKLKFSMEKEATCKSFSHYDSLYKNIVDENNLTYDISNGSILVNMSTSGAILESAFYRSTRYIDGGAGTWTTSDNIKSGELYYELFLGDKWVPLKSDDMKAQHHDVGYVEFCIPQVILQTDMVKASLFALAPVLDNGELRPRVVLYSLILQNTSQITMDSTLRVPHSQHKPYIVLEGDKYAHIEQLCVHTVTVFFVNTDKVNPIPTELSFTLSPGERKLFVSAIISPSEWQEYETVSDMDFSTILNQTISYYKKLVGELQILEKPVLADIISRSIIECDASILLDDGRNISCTNYGTFPAGNGVNIKDTFYTMLPACYFNPEYAKKAIRWLCKYSVRPKSVTFHGGVNHSLGNSVSAIMLASIYYNLTDDKKYFLDYPEFKNTARQLPAFVKTVVGLMSNLLIILVSGSSSGQFFLPPTIYSTVWLTMSLWGCDSRHPTASPGTL